MIESSSPAQHLDELGVFNHALVVDVGLPEEVVDLILVQLLAYVREDVPQLGSVDQPVTISVENLESLLQLLLGILVAGLRHHEADELNEINDAITVCVDRIHHIGQLCLSRVLAQRAHHRTQFGSCNVTVPIPVKQVKGLLVLVKCLLSDVHGEFVGHCVNYRRCGKSRHKIVPRGVSAERRHSGSFASVASLSFHLFLSASI